MNKLLIGGVVLVVIALGVVFMTTAQQEEATTQSPYAPDEVEVPAVNQEAPQGVVEQPTVVEDDVENEVPVPAPQPGTYTDYSQAAFDAAADQSRVYFFHAAWCPTCGIADRELTSKADQIPEGVTVFKTNYDTEDTLKERYNITYQHTFVQVDAQGNEVSKWNGGGLNEIIANVQ